MASGPLPVAWLPRSRAGHRAHAPIGSMMNGRSAVASPRSMGIEGAAG